MPNLSSIARPYALAAFDYAREKGELKAWKDFLEWAAFLVQQPAVLQLLTNPELPSEKMLALFQAFLSSLLDEKRSNFLLLLTQNKRLNVFPDIAETFNAYYAGLEKISHVQVITAVEVQDPFRQQLSKALTKRIHREVTLDCEVDPSIIGGAIVRIGDSVIDGSIRNQLTRLLNNLTS